MTSVMTGCSITKFIPENEFLINKVMIESTDKSINASEYEPYIKQKGNTKWFSALRIPLATYSLAGKDSTKWINKTLKNIGEKPVTLDSTLTESTCNDLRSAMQNNGFLNANVETRTKIHKKNKIDITYILTPGKKFHINNITYDIQDDNIEKKLDVIYPKEKRIKAGAVFSINSLEQERQIITSVRRFIRKTRLI